MIRFQHICILTTLLLCSCGRTPSEERFEKTTGISIPKNVEVLKDDYHDMIQDYAIEYSIRLTSDQLTEVTTSILSSKFFNPAIVGDEIIRDEYFPRESANSVWYRTNTGFCFTNRNDRTGVAVYNTPLK
tara:strand:- start:1212 stop:1601 length:390 start_codon:yes stop_codon:yes gene_type:complete